MKVEGPRTPQQTGKVKSKGKSGKGTGAASFGSMVESGSAEVAGGFSPHMVAKVDALLTVQAAEDPTEGAARGRMYERSERILDVLDDIRDHLLSGTLTVGDVISVADTVAAHREKIQDPQLTSILDEIDLRAQVELAKVRVAIKHLDM